MSFPKESMLRAHKPFELIHTDVCGLIKSSLRAHKPFELIHTDVCGLIKPRSLTKSNYFLLFIDNYSRKTWVYFLKE